MKDENNFSDIPGVELPGAASVVDPVAVDQKLSAIVAESGGDPGADPGADPVVVASSVSPQDARKSWYRLIYTCLRWLSIIFVPGWKLTEEEISTLADLWADAFVEMWPEGVAFGAVGDACIGTGELVGSRWGVARKLPESEPGSDSGENRNLFSRMFASRKNRG